MMVSSEVPAVTQCPHCRAKFRVRPEQVRLHAGLVRCGACRGIFDAVEHLIEGTLPSVDPIDDQADVGSPQTIVQGMPAMQPEVETPPGVAAMWTPHSGKDSRLTQAQGSTPTTSTKGQSVAGGRVNVDESPLAEPTPGALGNYRWRPPAQPSTPVARWALALLCVVATLGLMAQATYFLRDEIASRVPHMAPGLDAICTYLDCRLQPPKRGEALGFVGTDLTADPAHRGLLIFTATLRNSGLTSVAYPHLVLSLDGLGGELVVRRVFAPTEFAPATASLARGLAAGAEIEVKLYLDASQTNVVGFKIDHAYL